MRVVCYTDTISQAPLAIIAGVLVYRSRLLTHQVPWPRALLKLRACRTAPQRW